MGFFSLFWLIIFLTSCSFWVSIFYDNKNQLILKNNYQGFYVIDVGQGDALLYVTKKYQTLLIDTGKPGDSIVKKLENILGKYRKKIDVIILTHPDSDHVGEINNILGSYNVGLILYSPIYEARTDSKKDIDDIKSKNQNKDKNKGLTLPVFAGENLVFSDGQNSKINDGEKVYFLSPSFSGMTTFINKKESTEDNYFSVVSMIKNKDLIFAMADAPQKIEKVIASSNSLSLNLSGTNMETNFDAFSHLKNFTNEDFFRNQFDKVILKVGHHGSKTSSVPDFIQKLLPTDAILSYGVSNRYGHPNKEVLDLFASTSPKTKIHRTISGTVYFDE